MTGDAGQPAAPRDEQRRHLARQLLHRGVEEVEEQARDDGEEEAARDARGDQARQRIGRVEDGRGHRHSGLPFASADGQGAGFAGPSCLAFVFVGASSRFENGKERVVMLRRGVCLLIAGLVALPLAAMAQDAYPNRPCAGSCRSRPAARPTRCRASWWPLGEMWGQARRREQGRRLGRDRHRLHRQVAARRLHLDAGHAEHQRLQHDLLSQPAVRPDHATSSR